MTAQAPSPALTEIRNAYELLSGIIEGTEDLIAAQDAQFRYIAFNRAYREEFARHFGVTLEIGVSMLDAMAHLPSDQLVAERMVSRALAGERFTFEHPFGDAARGQRRFYQISCSPIRDSQGQIIGAAHIVRDMTRHHADEEALRLATESLEQRIARGRIELAASEERFRLMFEGVSVGIVQCSMDGSILMVNPGFCRMLGYTEQELVGRNVTELVFADDRQQSWGQLRRIIEGEIPSYTLEKRYLRKDGQLLWTSTVTSAVRGPEQEILFTVTLVQDITDRRRAEQALRESEERLLMAQEAGGIGVFDWNPSTGKVIWGPQLERIFGLRPGTFDGTYEFWARRIHPEDEGHLSAYFRGSMGQHAPEIEFEYRFYLPSGELRWMSARARFEYDAAGAPVRMIGINIDVTQRKRAEEALAQTSQRLEFHLENSPLAVIEFDADLRIRRWTASAQRILGYSAEEVVGQRLWDARFIAPEDRPRVEAVMARLLSGAEPRQRSVNRNVRKDGTVIHCEWYNSTQRDERGAVVSVLSLGLDVTERVQAQQAVARTERRFRIAVDNLPDMLVIYDAQRRIEFVNATGLRRLGRPLSDFIGRRSEEIWPGEVVARFLPHLLRTYETRAEQRFETTLQLPGGGDRFTQVVTYVPLLDDQGQIRQVMSIAHDITDRKVAEDELRQAKAAAEEASSAKDHFLAVLSHELRTPLTPVLTATQLMEMDGDLPPSVREHIAMIRRNVELEARLIDDLLDLTRISRGKLELHLAPVDLHDKVQHVVQICDSEIRARQIKLTLDLMAARPVVQADPARLQQMLWNLLKNAVKFTPEGGSIRISTRNADGWMIVTVEDSGIGIEPEALQRIFNAFEQGGREVTRLFGGLGLGLSITRGLVELHHGSISATSQGKGRGAAFTMELPLAAAGAVASPGGSQRPAPGHRRGFRVLLVEDHADTRRIMTRVLERFGHAVQSADSVAGGLRVAQAGEFDVLVCDIGLPDGSGHDLVRQVRAKWPMRAIALSGFGQDEDLRRSQEAGFSAHLTKPVNLTHLEATIRRVLEEGG